MLDVLMEAPKAHALPVYAFPEALRLRQCDVCGEYWLAFRYYNGYRVCPKHLDSEWRVDISARRELLYHTPATPEPELPTVPYKRRVVLDTEFDGLNFETAPLIAVQYWDEVDRQTVIVDVRQWSFDRIAGYLRPLLNDALVIGHNLTADLSVLWRYGIRPAAVFDTMAATAVLEGYRNRKLGSKDKDKNRGYNLEACTRRYAPHLAHLVDKETRSQFIGMSQDPERWNAPFTDELLDYMETDVVTTLAVYQAVQDQLLQRPELWPMVNLENAVVLPVVSMHVRGMPVHVQKWVAMISQFDPMIKDYTQKMIALMEETFDQVEEQRLSAINQKRLAYRTLEAQVKEELGEEWDNLPTEVVETKKKVTPRKNGLTRSEYQHAGIARWKADQDIRLPASGKKKELKPTSRDQVLDCIAALFGMRIKKFDREARKTIIASSHYTHDVRDFVEVYDTLQGFMSLQNKFGMDYLQKNVRNDHIYPKFNPVGPASGRFSSSGPNAQQIPKTGKFKEANVRGCFVAPDGWKLFGADFSQAEMRIAAALSEDENLCEALGPGKDLYSEIAIQVFNLPVDSPRDDENHLKFTLDSGIDARQAAKAIVLALDYGMGPASFAKRIGTDERTARKLIDDFKKRFPKLTATLEQYGKFTIATKRSFTRAGRWRDVSIDYRRVYAGYAKKRQEEAEKSAKKKNKKNEAPQSSEDSTTEAEEIETYESVFNVQDDYAEWREIEEYDSAEKAARGAIQRVGQNTPMQGGCADITKLAMVLFYNRLQALGIDENAFLIATIHDELLAMATDDCVAQAQTCLASSMEDAFRIVYPQTPLPPTKVWVSSEWIKG